MTAPRPYSEKPRWDEIGSVLIMGGGGAAFPSAALGLSKGVLVGSLLLVSGLVIRAVAYLVWEP